MTEAVAELRKTPLNARHRASGGRMVSFAGWDMPVEYAGIISEHMAVRTRAGIFDVSHMGEIEVAGKDALSTVQRLTANDAGKLEVGQAQLSALLTPRGTFVDDLLVYRMAPSHFLLVVNASNAEKDFAWIQNQMPAGGDVAVIDSSSRYALIAVQGPASREVLQPIATVDLGEIRPFWFTHGHVADARVTIARTGYTGEDGFEIFVPPNMADRVWQGLLDSGRSVEVVPVGLGARDTLRLEAAMRLYGNDIDESTTVLEAALGWVIGWDKGEFIGREALRAQRERGIDRKLVGFEMLDRGIARHGHLVVRAGVPVGTVTSGTFTPYLKKAIGLAYVPVEMAAPGGEIEIDIRGRIAKAQVVKLPFYRKPG